jgi:hypothetical protein
MIDKVKVGDVLTVQGSGYLSTYVRTFTVTKITKTRIVCGTVRFNQWGILLPRDKYIFHNIVAINGIKVE